MFSDYSPSRLTGGQHWPAPEVFRNAIGGGMLSDRFDLDVAVGDYRQKILGVTRFSKVLRMGQEYLFFVLGTN